ncbi:MAG: cytochrome c3 family protein [Phycisphaerae bacterium]|nr:cytochrome c3 family protein [Phycisphaerae bacterium]
MKTFRLLTALLLAVCVYPVRAEVGQLVGQGSDGNRSTPVHQIELYDEEGNQIRPFDKDPKPFSTRITCGRCHEYGTIASGWHFNGYESEAFNDEGELVKIDWGRPGQPWVLTDSKTRTQIPLSGRKWPGTFSPDELRISSWKFLEMISSHFPGGSYGEIKAEQPYEERRQEISGLYEVNCLACHNADPHQDQNMAALQAARQNYRWIPAASSRMADVSGDTLDLTMFYDPEVNINGPTMTYRKDLFDSEDTVFFDITGKPSNERCYFCHSNQNLSVSEDREWTRDEDVHLKSGLKCVDCHRNGDNHMITRGIETEGDGKTLTCEGCHLPDPADTPQSGRLGAPEPKHRGIPTIHFEKLTCTACHSGTWPAEEAARWKTARMHETGLHGPHTPYVPQPHVYAPVLMKGAGGKIGPYKLFWPAYWAAQRDDAMTPIPPEQVLEKAGDVLGAYIEKTDDWKPLTEQQIAGVLERLSTGGERGVYIAGGKSYRLDAEGNVTSCDDEAAQPYAWPMAHDVRPAEQSLGVRMCKDCHTTDSPFFFGTVEMDTPVKADNGVRTMEMIQLQGIDRLYMWVFNASFVFRPFLKIVAFASCGLIVLVLLAYGVRAVAAVSNACTEEPE